MSEAPELNIIVSNILGEKRYSHCRLCLKYIQDHYVRFEDAVCLAPASGDFQPLSEVLSKLLGDQICEEVTGVDAVCTDCVDKVLESARFIKKCNNSTEILNKVVDNLTETLNVDIELSHEDHSMYIIVNEYESKLMIVDNRQKRENEVRKYNTNNQFQFECLECDIILDNVIEFKVHNLSHHGTFTCEKCAQTYFDELGLSLHECIKIKNKTNKENKSNVDKSQENIYVCKDCGKACRGLDKLQKHEEKHTIKRDCPKCGKSYHTKEFFFKHVKLCTQNLLDPHPFRSNMEKSYYCNDCGKGYSTPGGLRVHNRFVHGNAKPHVCQYCDKKFTAPSYLKVHMIKHTGEKKFKCDLCGNRFVSKEALLYHTRRHTGEKPYACKQCDERFVNASSRAEHVKFKHVGPTLMCDICSRKFVTANFLKQHMMRHLDPTSKLYTGRSMIPPNMPGEQNMRRIKTEIES